MLQAQVEDLAAAAPDVRLGRLETFLLDEFAASFDDVTGPLAVEADQHQPRRLEEVDQNPPAAHRLRHVMQNPGTSDEGKPPVQGGE